MIIIHDATPRIARTTLQSGNNTPVFRSLSVSDDLVKTFAKPKA
jgi:hypothetical protein